MLLPMVADAALFDFEVDGIYYKISNGSKVSVARTYSGNDYSGNVIIPEIVTFNETAYSVTAIDSFAFSECSGLTSITIPKSISSIGANAFNGCSNLDTVYISDIGAWCNINFYWNTSYQFSNPIRYAEHIYINGVETTDLIIPDSVTSISDHAFENCQILTNINIPNTVTSIGNYAFGNCRNLTCLEIPNSVTTIGDYAFWYCINLPSVTIGNSVTSLGSYAFAYCRGLKSINIDASLIGDRAFLDCTEVIDLTIGNSVNTIGSAAFNGCSKLTGELIIPNSVTSIGDNAFYGCFKLTRVAIPNSVTYIGNCAFSYCISLNNISVASDNPALDSRDGCNAIIETATNTLIIGCKNSIIPNGVTSIGNMAFYYCPSLKNIDIPNGVTSIGNWAFYYCSGLKNIDISNSVTSIGNHAFSYCAGLMSVEIPNSVTHLGDYAFEDCSGLTSVEIPNSVTHMGKDAFCNCTRINSLIISGEGEWQEISLNSVSSTSPKLYIDSRITGIKRMFAFHSDVYCFATEPPTCDNYSFQNYSGTLHVPATSLAAYFTAEYWCNFANIVGDAVEPEEVCINQDSVKVNLGDQFSLMASVTPANATPNNVTWISTNPSVATINYNGIVTAMRVGECDIIAQCLNKKAICHVVVNDTTLTISLDQQEAMVLPNHIITLTPSASPVMPNLSVTSSDPSVAAARVVNNKVQVVGIKEGTTTIIVGSADGTAIPATCLVTVYTEPGDMNCDGFVNISDVTSLIDYLLSGDDSQISTKNADVNDDGSINISDVTTLIDTLLSGNG